MLNKLCFTSFLSILIHCSLHCHSPCLEFDDDDGATPSASSASVAFVWNTGNFCFVLDNLFSSSNTDLGYDLFSSPETVDSSLSASENSASNLLPFDDSPALLSFNGGDSASDILNPDDLASDLFSTDLPVNWSLDETAPSLEAGCVSYEEGQLIGRVRRRADGADICSPTLFKEPSTDIWDRPEKKENPGGSPSIDFIPGPRRQVVVPSLSDFDNAYCPQALTYAVCDSGDPDDRRSLDGVIFVSLFHVTHCQCKLMLHPRIPKVIDTINQ